MTTLTPIARNDYADGALYDKVNDMANTLNSSKLEKEQLGLRKASTAYTSGATCFCEYHGDLQLICTSSGTTSSGALNTSGNLTVGQTITDGSVIWTVRKTRSDLNTNSITSNASHQLQTVGVINSRDNSTAVKTWTGTLAQYNAIVSKDSNTLYNITDDSSALSYQAYTKAEVDALLAGKQPVISGTSGGGDYVIDWKNPTSLDPTWYRVYKSGWVEQGGYVGSVTAYNSFIVKDLIISMANNLYSVSAVMVNGGSSNTQYNSIVIQSVSGTQYRIKTGCQESFDYCWEVKGVKA